MLEANLLRYGVDLAVDTDTLKIDVTNNRIGINTATPAQALDVVGNAAIGGDVVLTTGTPTISITSSSAADSKSIIFSSSAGLESFIVHDGGSEKLQLATYTANHTDISSSLEIQQTGSVVISTGGVDSSTNTSHLTLSENGAGVKSTVISGAVFMGDLNSTAITGTATDQRLQITDTEALFGEDAGYTIGNNNNTQVLTISGDRTGILGANILLSGGSHASTAKDMSFRSAATTWMNWDESAGELVISTGTGTKTSALTIDSSQNATFANDMIISTATPGLSITSTQAADNKTLTFSSSVGAEANLQHTGSSGNFNINNFAADGASLASVIQMQEDGVVLFQTGGVDSNSADTILTLSGATGAQTSVFVGSVTIPTLVLNGTLTAPSIIVSDLTTTRVPFATTNGALTDNANLTYASGSGTLSVTGKLVVDNMSLDGNDISITSGTELSINDGGLDIDFRVESDTDANCLFVNAGTNNLGIGTSSPNAQAKLHVNTTGSMIIPVGTTGNRPDTPATGMFRWNTSLSTMEIYDGSAWTYGVTVDLISGGGGTVDTASSANGIEVTGALISKASGTSVGTSAVVVASFPLATFRSGKYLVQVTKGTTYEVSEVLVVHNGSVATQVQYGVTFTDATLGSTSAAIVSANVELSYTGVAAGNTVKVQPIFYMEV